MKDIQYKEEGYVLLSPVNDKSNTSVVFELSTFQPCAKMLVKASHPRLVQRALGAYVKGKAIPLHAWTGLEGSRRMRIPDFKTVGTCMW
jgi:hypothetical protein